MEELKQLAESVQANIMAVSTLLDSIDDGIRFYLLDKKTVGEYVLDRARNIQALASIADDYLNQVTAEQDKLVHLICAAGKQGNGQIH